MALVVLCSCFTVHLSNYYDKISQLPLPVLHNLFECLPPSVGPVRLVYCEPAVVVSIIRCLLSPGGERLEW